MVKRIALIICINYFGTLNELNGCINDGVHIINFLKNRLKFKDTEIRFINDRYNTQIKPTKDNIVNQLKKVANEINATKEPVELFIHYSGHGTQVQDVNNDEINIYDEVIVPVDFMSNGFISDDTMFSILNSITNTKCRLMAIFDCCNSGTILDLKYKYIENNKMKIENNKANLKFPAFMISGCKDFQTSADYFSHETDKYGGALSNAVLRFFYRKRRVKFIPLIKSIRQDLKNKEFTQIPQLTTNVDINNKTFMYITRKNGTTKLIHQGGNKRNRNQQRRINQQRRRRNRQRRRRNRRRRRNLRERYND